MRAQTAPVPRDLPAAPVQPPLDPTSPMAELPGLGVAWPDLGKRDPLEGDPATTAAANVDAAGERHYAVDVEGLETLGAVRALFDAQSSLRAGAGKTANVAQIDRRIREDRDLLDELLRAGGYYDASVDSNVVPEGARLHVMLKVVPGPIYRFTAVTVTGLDTATRESLGVKIGDAVDANIVTENEAALRERLGRMGYPFAKVADARVDLDHETRDVSLDLKVESGGQRRIGAIRVEGAKPPFGAKHTAVIARFKPGELYDQAMIDDLRRALVATGLMASARVEPVAAGDDKADIVVTMEPAPYHTIAGEAGYATGEGFHVTASWQHRNFIHPEGAVTVSSTLGTLEQSLGAVLRMGNFRKRDQVLNARIQAAHTVYPAYDARTFTLGGNLERQTNIIWQKRWTWSVGAELIASDERDFVPVVGIRQRRTYFIGALPGTLAYDGSDNLLNPTKGFRLSGRFSPEVSLQGGTFTYLRTQIDGSLYQSVGQSLVLAGRARIGGIAGASANDIAPSRLYYAGGGGSVRGFGYQRVGPVNVINEPIGGRSLAEFSLEARVRLKAFGGNFGVVPFIDAGNVYSTSYPKFTNMRVGAGVGLRYYSNFGPIRIDVGTPIKRRPGESLIAVYVSLGQAF